MATIEFDAFVNASHNDKNAETFVLKTAEPHRRKVAGSDDYETYGRTFRDVFLSLDADADVADSFKGGIWEEGDRVHVLGQEVTRPREYNGKTYYDLVVYATVVDLIVTEPKREPRKGPATQRKQTSRR